ncbi:MAG: glycerophosphodiester phosphodiesterase [Rhodospirillales bacterium]|nr:glycerophosphodiester phosphodiesterase [Rhodospirillales bacterium]
MIAVFGHRGARGLVPENTLAGFALAEKLNLTGVELDIAVTADGVPVAHHDPRLNPDFARDSSGAYVGGDAPFISALTFQQISAYDVGRLRTGSAYAKRFAEQAPVAGARIPALEDILAASTKLDFLLELKTYPDQPEATLGTKLMVAEVVRVLRGANRIGNAMLLAFDWRVLEEATVLEPALSRCCLTAPETVANADVWFGKTRMTAFGGSLPRAVASTGAKAWAPFHESLQMAEMDEAKRLGLEVIPWTVNEAEAIHRMIDFGVDGIISDRPDWVRDILAKRGIEMASPGFVASKMCLGVPDIFN